MPIGLHECRHTFASLMIAAGVNAKALSTYLGHSSIQITLDRYGHLMPGNEQEAARLLDRYLHTAAEDLALNAPLDSQGRVEISRCGGDSGNDVQRGREARRDAASRVTLHRFPRPGALRADPGAKQTASASAATGAWCGSSSWGGA